MEPNPNLVLWGTILGTVLPILISKINARTWTSTTKGLVAFLVCLVAAIGTAYFKGDLTAGDVVSALLGTFGAAIVTYNQFWKPTGIGEALERE